MFWQIESRSILFRLLVGCFIIAIGFLFLSFLIASSGNNNIQAQSTDIQNDIFSGNFADDSNAVTASFAGIVREIGLTTYQIKDGANKSTKSMINTTYSVATTLGNSTSHGIKTTTSHINRGINYAGKITNKGISSAVSAPNRLISSITNIPLVKNFVRPSEYEDVSLIDPNSPELLVALVALPPAPENSKNANINASNNLGPIWPINGRVTTNFGVPHRPYQSIHTGMDISSGKHSGINPIKPFRSGKVIEVIKSKRGYGNHVLIDHGNGVISVYAHLYSMKVNVGQEVDINSVIGYEGSTGMSTGTHLHFEVRVNGKAANPRKFIANQP